MVGPGRGVSLKEATFSVGMDGFKVLLQPHVFGLWLKSNDLELHVQLSFFLKSIIDVSGSWVDKFLGNPKNLELEKDVLISEFISVNV